MPVSRATFLPWLLLPFPTDISWVRMAIIIGIMRITIMMGIMRITIMIGIMRITIMIIIMIKIGLSVGHVFVLVLKWWDNNRDKEGRCLML